VDLVGRELRAGPAIWWAENEFGVTKSGLEGHFRQYRPYFAEGSNMKLWPSGYANLWSNNCPDHYGAQIYDSNHWSVFKTQPPKLGAVVCKKDPLF
jgi:phage terminase large subunit-like protein